MGELAYDYVCKGRLREHGDHVEWINLIKEAIERIDREAE